MAQSIVVRLDEYRSRRMTRLDVIRALHGADAERGALVEYLADSLELLGADRAAIVQIDDYTLLNGPRVSPFCVVDLATDVPRRSFSIEPLTVAADAGVPGFVDYPDMERAGGTILAEGPRSFAAVCLGSDGMRTWYMVADSRTPRGPIDEASLRKFMFAAGECSAIVLHRDLPTHTIHGGESDPDEEESARDFRGFPILRDLDGREDDLVFRERIGLRFLVGRFLINRARDGFDLDSESARSSSQSCLGEVTRSRFDSTDPEFAAWTDVLEGVLESDLARVMRGAVGVAVYADQSDHIHSAKVLLRVAYELTTHTASLADAVEVMRRLGRVHRRLGQWENSERCYRAAKLLATLTGDTSALALVLDGSANTLRERGDLDGARRILEELSSMVEELDDRRLRGLVAHSMMALEANANRLFHAAHNGWKAVEAFQEGEEYMQALSDLAGVFIMVGEYDSAEDALNVVRAESESELFRIAAKASLVTLPGLRGDRATFEKRYVEFDRSVQIETLPPNVSTQISLERGQVLSKLGDDDRARAQLERALKLSTKHGYDQLRLQAETALHLLGEVGESCPAPPVPNLQEEQFLLDEARGGVRALVDR